MAKLSAVPNAVTKVRPVIAEEGPKREEAAPEQQEEAMEEDAPEQQQEAAPVPFMIPAHQAGPVAQHLPLDDEYEVDEEGNFVIPDDPPPVHHDPEVRNPWTNIDGANHAYSPILKRMGTCGGGGGYGRGVACCNS